MKGLEFRAWGVGVKHQRRANFLGGIKVVDVGARCTTGNLTGKEFQFRNLLAMKLTTQHDFHK